MAFSAKFSNARRRVRPIARAVTCGIFLLTLPACGIPPRRHAQPPPPLPESFVGATSPVNSADLGAAEFYQDPLLLGLLEQALANNRELRILNEEVQIASTEILARSGAYLPFLTAGPSAGLERFSERTIEGAAIKVEPFVLNPEKFFKNPHASYFVGTNLTWQLDIYRQLRNARDAAAQRYVAAIERRNSFVIGMVAEIAENYYRLMALDKRLENLNQINAFLEQSLRVAEARKEAARDTELAVLRFEAELNRNRSELLIVAQDIIEAENRINVLAYRYPQPVGRNSANFFDLDINTIGVGVPSELLQNRPDIRQAERELVAAGLDVAVARANFYPQLILNAGVGWESFNLAGLFSPTAIAGNVFAGFVGPLVNRRSIKAEYLTTNARQLQAIYDYQRTILGAFTEVVNRLTEVQNYSRSVAIKKQQLTSLEAAVDVANQLFQFARVEYLDVLTAQRDLRDARTALIDTKELQLTATVRAYQALGGGALLSISEREELLHPIPHVHEALSDDDFWKLSQIHYGSGKYFRALRASLERILPYRAQTFTADPHPVLPTSPAVIEAAPGPALPIPDAESSDDSGLPPALPNSPPPPDEPGPFDLTGTISAGSEAIVRFPSPRTQDLGDGTTEHDLAK
ncbi:TolC family protein [Tautonia sociabilis]|uniref:TolC family protein n=1 Tax=Tautonia sociabilis TaxID=2080755 RepID=A0A432MDV2_9BACT|nr:TolC family protein [Tautonia sociabilis]RUL83177.1 TolC family protein [Tautonia sociabilis]